MKAIRYTNFTANVTPMITKSHIFAEHMRGEIMANLLLALLLS